MTGWNYRAMRRVERIDTGTDDGFESWETWHIIEAYYDDDGKIDCWCEAKPHGASLPELLADLEMMRHDAEGGPHLEWADLPKDEA